MNQWDAEGFVLSARPHGENGLIVSVFTEHYGRCVGYIPGGQARSKRAGIEPGAKVYARWSARVADQMGTLSLDALAQPASLLMNDGMRLAALTSACALCETALPEREAHPALYHGLAGLMDQLDHEMWGVSYVAWEVAFMKELGYALDFTRCAGGGSADNLRYMSPKSGVAVSEECGLIYKAKLLELPEFLRPAPDLEDLGDLEDVYKGLKLTGYFLEHWVFNHHRSGVPDSRLTLIDRVARGCDAVLIADVA